MRIGSAVPLLAIIGMVGCKSGKIPEPILIGHVQTSIAQKRGIEFALADLAAKPEGWPLGRPIKVIHAEALAQDDPIFQAQAVRLSQLNHPVAVIAGPMVDSTEALGRALGPDTALGISLDAAYGYTLPRNVFPLRMALSEQVELIPKWLEEQGLPLRVRISPSNGESADKLRTRLRKIEGVKILDADCDVYIQLDYSQSHLDYDLEKLLLPEKPMPGIERIPAQKPAAEQPHSKGLRVLALSSDRISPYDFDSTKNLLRTVDGKVFLLQFNNISAAQKDLEARYRERFLEEPYADFYQSYQAVEILAEAVRRAGSSQPAKVREVLLKQDAPFETVLGPVQFGIDQRIRYPKAKFEPLP